jgi:hypothetical protein
VPARWTSQCRHLVDDAPVLADGIVRQVAELDQHVVFARLMRRDIHIAVRIEAPDGFPDDHACGVAILHDRFEGKASERNVAVVLERASP